MKIKKYLPEFRFFICFTRYFKVEFTVFSPSLYRLGYEWICVRFQLYKWRKKLEIYTSDIM